MIFNSYMTSALQLYCIKLKFDIHPRPAWYNVECKRVFLYQLCMHDLVVTHHSLTVLHTQIIDYPCNKLIKLSK